MPLVRGVHHLTVGMFHDVSTLQVVVRATDIEEARSIAKMLAHDEHLNNSMVDAIGSEIARQIKAFTEYNSVS
jgi:hypothetical protein